MPFWIYCKSCGLQTPEPNSATRSKCDCGGQMYIVDMTPRELDALTSSGLTVKEFVAHAMKTGQLKERF